MLILLVECLAYQQINPKEGPKMPRVTGIRLVPIKEGLSSRTWYPETRILTAKDFRGVIPKESLRAVFPTEKSKIFLTFGKEEVHVSFLDINSVSIGGHKCNDKVFIAIVGSKDILTIGDSDFMVSAFYAD